MVELHHIYVAAFVVTAILSLAVAGLTWRHREEPGATPVLVLMLGVAAWCVAEALYWWSPTLAVQKFWLLMTHPCVWVIVVTILVFAFETSGMEHWCTPRRILLVSLVPVALCIIAVTNPGGILVTSYTAHAIGPHTYAAPQHGPLWWVYLLIVYGMIVIGFVLISRTYYRSTGSLRIRSGTGLLGLLVPFVVSIANQLSPRPIEGLETAAFFFTGLFFAYAIIEGVLLDNRGQLVTARHMARANKCSELLATENDDLENKLNAAALAAERLYDLATRDGLTGLYNRRAMTEYLAREMARSQRTGAPLAIIMLDIDRFKEINDSFSHAAGDAALALVGESLLGITRPMDIVCRYGGDEFVIIMPDTDIDIAFQRAEESRARMDGSTLHREADDIRLSVSVGVSASPRNGVTAAAVMAAADSALHKAKESGRNRTVIA